jgi:hypothetical protein
MDVEVSVLVPVSVEPITSADLPKTRMRIDFTDTNTDADINFMISEARQYGEQLTGRSFATQTIQAIIAPTPEDVGALSGPVGALPDSWQYMERPDIPLFGTNLIQLPFPYGPVQSLTSVEYQLTRMDVPEWTLLTPTDINGNANYRVDLVADPATLNLFTILAASRFRLTYVAGYTVLPFHLKNAMKSLISFNYDNRDGDPIPQGIIDMFHMKKVFYL